MEINPNDLKPKDVYKLLSGAVIPRPIAWVSTVSKDGINNLAPYSFANALSGDPPTVMFSGGRPNGNNKDSIQNVLDTEEFVFNIVTYSLAQQMNISATTSSPEVDEFKEAGLTPGKSKLVKAPRVFESPINFECKLIGTFDISGGVGPGSLVVFGRVVHMHIADDVLLPDHKIDPLALDPLARLSGPSYSKIEQLLNIERKNWGADVDPKKK